MYDLIMVVGEVVVVDLEPMVPLVLAANPRPSFAGSYKVLSVPFLGWWCCCKTI